MSCCAEGFPEVKPKGERLYLNVYPKLTPTTDIMSFKSIVRIPSEVEFPNVLYTIWCNGKTIVTNYMTPVMNYTLF